MIKSSEDLASYKIFIDSREKFLKWVAVITVVLGMFGFVSLSNIIETIRNQAATQVTNNIVPRITKELQEGEASKELRKQVVEKISNEVRATILQEARSQVNQILTNFKKNLEELSKQNQKLQVATARLQTDIDSVISQPKQPQLQQRVEEQRYLVVATSSSQQSSIEEERKRLVAKLGDRITSYSMRICPPKPGNRLYALVLSDPLTLKEAQALVEKAKNDGFQQDTYAIRASSTFFDFGSMCN